jgi:phosphotransferase system  glucose/maltose/N-acetylglucosamine-specific IIC component
MTIAMDSKPLSYQPISNLVITTLLAAIGFLAAFQIRDSIVLSVGLITPENTTKKLMFNYFLAVLFVFLAVIIAWAFSDRIDDSKL